MFAEEEKKVTTILYGHSNFLKKELKKLFPN